ncbi:hypothetical protein Tel_10970 [Candidatus Tenderia electrophaga]|jgi:murein DD-endopeptidase MepM/ murein hydrolase activator NlpD|uniref:Peptidase M23 n=1 Tax=Candidatus Tenderia electrophaga TaxID=1748243 RepID=A0A0S2TEN9_9GAMM|nr:hypothetical protein Tel_10970 [Candidatus Tenderia electrophaga]
MIFRLRSPVAVVCGLLISLATWAQAAELPRQESVPGGIAVIKLDTSAEHPPKASYKGKPVMVLRHQDGWYAVIGIPLSAKTGKHLLKTSSAGRDKTYRFQVKDKAYETQHITIKDKRKVTPNADDLKRIRAESKQISAALSHWDDRAYTDSPLLELPAEGPLSSPFGLRRFFNELPRKPHSGIDIAASKGAPITAPAGAKVILTGNFFFNGNSVFLDHGQGLITMYCHMDTIEVREGEMVERGQRIGTIGMTGRVTGPHLHWSVSLNDARIDPGLIVPALQPSLAADQPAPGE